MRSYYKWTNAAALLDHYLDTGGTPLRVDAEQMLRDLPSFRSDVQNQLRVSMHDSSGTFDSGWTSTRAKETESLDWYYGLNGFQYRVVGGHTANGSGWYQVEVKKRYDWGIPTENRRDVSGGGVTLRQVDIAHLHSAGIARGFDVYGSTRVFSANEALPTRRPIWPVPK